MSLDLSNFEVWGFSELLKVSRNTFSCYLNSFVLRLKLNLKNMSFEPSANLTNSAVNAAEDEQN